MLSRSTPIVETSLRGLHPKSIDDALLLVGDDTYAGLLLPDGERVHLILVPVRGLLERLAGTARLAGVGLLLLALLVLSPRLIRVGGARALVAAIRGLFG